MVSQMTREQCRAELTELLGRSIACVNELYGNLATERDSLERGDIDALNGAAAEKQMFVNKLEGLETARGKISVACGFGKQPEQMPLLAEWCSDASAIAESWQQFIEIAKDCDEMNTSNGAIINVRHQQTRNALSLLRNGGPDIEIYGPHGKTSSTRGAQSLTEI